MPYYIKRKPKTPKSGIKERKPSTATLVRKADAVFSKYIRLRDSAAYNYKYFRCISCGQIKPFEQMDCGHFISRTHMATRFDEENAHGECRFCNRFSADHIIAYQRNLEAKIGKERVDMLLARGRMTKKWSAFELQLLIKHYQQEVDKMQGKSI